MHWLKHVPSYGQYNGTDYKGRQVYNFDGGDDDGGSPPPQPTQTSQLTIPEYAKPYMENLLGRAEALTTSPYQTYGGERLAQIDPLQQQAYQKVSGMGMPGQFEFGTGLAGAGGLASLSAGQQYMGMATSPQAQQAFMSPYMQNVVDVQKAAAVRDAQKAQLAQNLGTARQGTYGGARQLLATTERERALQGQLGEIQAKGLQSAYDQAIQAMQFGTQAGLTGAGQATQAGTALGQLGATQAATGMDVAKLQEQFGASQRQSQQQALDLAYQDFLTQQQFPYTQMAFMSDILRGTSSLASTGGKAIYQAPPSQTSQIAGLGLGALGLYNLAKG